MQCMLGKQFGGAERSFVDLCAALATRGHEVLALCESRALVRPYLENIEKVTTHQVTVSGSWDILAQRRIRNIVDGFRPQIFQAHLARAAHLAAPAAKAFNIPTLAKTHNYVNLKYYTAVDHLVPTTIKQQQYLETLGVAAPRLTRIPNFSAMTSMTPRDQPQIGELRLIALGRLVHKKGFDVLLEALAIVRATGALVTLEIAGDGPEKPKLQTLTDQLRLSSAVAFLGWQASVEGCLAQADAFILPSRAEPFGIVCLEAMALGVPIVATRTDGPLEILDSETAILVERESVEALARAILLTVNEPTAARRRAVAARERFDQLYCEEAVVAQYLSLYNRLLVPRD
jgi:glycosyltransferase involved in cell wall biosynthesis